MSVITSSAGGGGEIEKGRTRDTHIEEGYRECVEQAYRTMAACTRLFGKGENNGLWMQLGSWIMRSRLHCY